MHFLLLKFVTPNSNYANAYLSGSVVKCSGEHIQEEGALAFDLILVHMLYSYTEHAQ